MLSNFRGMYSAFDSTEFKTIAKGSSSDKSGSVAHGALCKGLEDSRCSWLAQMTLSLPNPAAEVGDEDDTE